MQFFTLGVYGYSEQEFLNELQEKNIDLFIDIRQRRGVRGKKYSFVNSNYLQQILKNEEIVYRHEINLAPTTEIRNTQKLADSQKNILKNSRNELSNVFKDLYDKEILSNFNFTEFVNGLNNQHKNIVLFCVEAIPAACHRGMVAEKLKTLGYTVKHITK